MKRRDFCRATMAAGVMGALPGGRVLAAMKQGLTQVISDVPAINTSGGEITLERAAVEELQGSLRGELLMPGNSGYDTARAVWNAMIDRHPALIARCEGATGRVPTPLPSPGKETCLYRSVAAVTVSPENRSVKVA